MRNLTVDLRVTRTNAKALDRRRRNKTRLEIRVTGQIRISVGGKRLQHLNELVRRWQTTRFEFRPERNVVHGDLERARGDQVRFQRIRKEEDHQTRVHLVLQRPRVGGRRGNIQESERILPEEKTTEENHFHDGEDASDEGLDRRRWIVLSHHFYLRIMCSNKLRELIKHIAVPKETDSVVLRMLTRRVSLAYPQLWQKRNLIVGTVCFFILGGGTVENA